jgi:CheY-like chemotaxis protein
MSDGRPWVLVIDDDEDIRSMVAVVLEMHGYGTVGACDGQEALHVLRNGGRPCLILLDLMMPHLNGPSFAAAMHAEPALRDLPIVVISGDVTAPETAAALGAAGFLIKPFDLEDLVMMVRGCATRPEAERRPEP